MAGLTYDLNVYSTMLDQMGSPIMARTNVKPRGYNGDSEMMRLIYLNDYQGDSTFGRLLHKYSVSRAAAQAVRNRRTWIASMIHRYAAEHPPRPPALVRVLSVACGPAMEVRDILGSPEECRRLHFSLFDQDPQALLEASGLIREIETRQGVDVSVDFIKESVRTMLVTRALQERWGQFHFIYSMGLLDYLTAPVATAVLRKLFQLMEPGGEMVIGNFALDNPNRVFMEYWHDWKIIHRSAEDLRRLAMGITGAQVDVKADETGIQMLLDIRKKADHEQGGGAGAPAADRPRPGRRVENRRHRVRRLLLLRAGHHPRLAAHAHRAGRGARPAVLRAGRLHDAPQPALPLCRVPPLLHRPRAAAVPGGTVHAAQPLSYLPATSSRCRWGDHRADDGGPGGIQLQLLPGLNLVIIGVNLLMPWRAEHTGINTLIILAMYVGLTLASPHPYTRSLWSTTCSFSAPRACSR